jgi:hypothetical protein
MRVNKKAWILAQDKALGAGELVRLARAEGIRLDPNYVHMTRYHARKQDAEGLVGGETAADIAVRKAFMKLCVRAGTINAKQWLAEIRAADV